MYVILIYDAGEKRVGKFHKICRKYLSSVQLSVFEGELTSLQLKRLKFELLDIMNEKEDSLIIYKLRTLKYFDKETYGVEKDDGSRIL